MDWPRGRAPHRSDSFDAAMGKFVAWAVIVHTAAHLARWGIQHAVVKYLFGSQSGVTGVVALLYCGGAKPVSDALTAISKDLGISFRKESFAW